jgi:hypothetical protein
MTAKRVLGLAGMVFGLVFVVPSVASAASSPGVRVIGENEQVLAIFKTAKCTKGKHYFHAEAFSTDKAYELDAGIRDFSGFHPYEVALGSTNPHILFESRQAGSPAYSNEFEPPYPVPGAGQIRFSPNGKRVGIGFGPAMWSDDGSSAVVLAGGLECRYPKKRR